MYKFKPILKSMLWGGEKIIPYKRIVSDQKQVGESWELSGVKGNESVVAEGPEAGTTLPELIARHGAALLGKVATRRQPLATNPARATGAVILVRSESGYRSIGDLRGKSVVATDEGAHLRSGFAKQVTPAEYAASVENNTITDLLTDYAIHPGDVFFLPAGRVHSIGAGAFIAEIQQTSNITYRIYDFNRRDANGNTRELHTELAKEAIDYTVLPDYRTHYTPARDSEVELVSCPYFTTSLLDLDEERTIDLTTLDSFLVVICIEGAGTLREDNGTPVAVHQGETVLIPASTKSLHIAPDGAMKILTSCIR